jgi:poly [ADP-ribose] polymerase
VTQKQVEKAQAIIDQLSPFLKQRKKTEPVNKLLLELYGVIPRRMSNVKLYLLDFDTISTKDHLEQVERLVSNEQDTLDVMRGQVQVNTAQKNVKADDKKTILDAMGIEIHQTIPANVKEIQSLFTECGRHYKGSFKVINKKTQEKFDKFTSAAQNKERRLFWHGSRNENWWSILDSGLVLRPTNAVINGKMFGYGVYFADKDRKSFNYTSYRGSYWARGTDSTAFMAVFDVHVGKQLHVKHHQSWCCELTEKNLKARGDYDSLFAEGGADLRNNEFIVYNDAQCTIKYLVEFGD